MKLDPVMKMMDLGLRACILDHVLADVYTHQRHRWIGLGRFDAPTPSSAADIKYTTKDSRVGLLWRDTTHPCCDHMILEVQTREFFLVLSILNDIRAGIIIGVWVKRDRHNAALLLLAVCLVPHAHRATLPLAHSVLQGTCYSLARYYTGAGISCREEKYGLVSEEIFYPKKSPGFPVPSVGHIARA